MKTIPWLCLLLLLPACAPDETVAYRTAPTEPRRYELTAGTRTFLLDTRSGRVWLWDSTDFLEVTPNTLDHGMRFRFRVDPDPTNAFTDLIP